MFKKLRDKMRLNTIEYDIFFSYSLYLKLYSIVVYSSIDLVIVVVTILLRVGTYNC